MTFQTYIEPKVTRAVQPDHLTVSLSEFNLEEVAEYLRANGYQVDGAFSRALMDRVRDQTAQYCPHCADDDDVVQGLLIEDDQLARVQTLALCGQPDAAREFVLQIVSDYLGRTL